MKTTQLGAFEELVLMTVAILKDDAYGVSLRQEMEDRLKKSVSVSALQTALRRMEDKGFLNSTMGEATAVRGGKRKRYFKVTALGMKVLREAQELRQDMWQAIPKYEFEFKF